jgi:hypothetical protein
MSGLGDGWIFRAFSAASESSCTVALVDAGGWTNLSELQLDSKGATGTYGYYSSPIE